MNVRDPGKRERVWLAVVGGDYFSVITPRRDLMHVPMRNVLMVVETIGDARADFESRVLAVAIHHEEFIRGSIGFSMDA